MKEQPYCFYFHRHNPHLHPVMFQESEHINLKVAGQDGSVVQFKIKRHTPLAKLMKAYCERQVHTPTPSTPPPSPWPCLITTHCTLPHSHYPHCTLFTVYQGLAMKAIRFRFDGQPISDTDTPAQVSLLLLSGCVPNYTHTWFINNIINDMDTIHAIHYIGHMISVTHALVHYGYSV